MRTTLKPMLALLLLLTGAKATAQTLEGFDLERLRLNPSGEGTLTLGSAQLLPKGTVQGVATLHYQRSPLIASRHGERLGAYVRDRLVTHVSAGYGVTDALEVGMSLSWVTFQVGDDLSSYGLRAPAAMGLGTPFLYGRYLLLEQGVLPLSLMLHGGIGLPFGSGRAIAADGGFTLQPRLVASSSLLGGLLLASAELGLELRPAFFHASGNVGSSAQVAVGARVDLSRLGAPAGLSAEAALRGGVPFGASPVAGELLLGARMATPVTGMDTFLLVGPGLGNAPGTPAFRVLAGVSLGQAVGALPFL